MTRKVVNVIFCMTRKVVIKNEKRIIRMKSSNFKENRKLFSKIGLIFVIGTILIYALQIGLSKLFNAVVDERYMDFGFLVAMLPIYVVAFPIMAFLFSKVPVEKPIEKKKMSFKEMFCYFTISYSAMYIFNLFGNLVANFIKIFKKTAVENSILEIATSNNLWMNFFIMVLCAPIVEEFLFRKFIIDRTVKFGEKTAILLSGIMFGFFHGNIYQFCYAFALGLVFAYLYVKSGQIKYSIILHMIVNFMGGVLGVIMLKITGLMDVLSEAGQDPAEVGKAMMNNVSGLLIFLLYFLVILAIVITGVVLLLVNIKRINFKQAVVEIQKGERFKTIILNLGMGLFFILWTAIIIYNTVV